MPTFTSACKIKYGPNVMDSIVSYNRVQCFTQHIIGYFGDDFTRQMTRLNDKIYYGLIHEIAGRHKNVSLAVQLDEITS